jgi:hypothetical protein
MAQLLQVIGFTWALLGMGNLVMMFTRGVSVRLATAGLFINVLLFVLPGLALVAWGTVMRTRAKGQTPT